MNVTTTGNAPQERRAPTLVMACIGVFVAYLPVTTVSASLPAIQRALDTSTSQLSWVSVAFVLPMAALILTAGVFGDVHGRKKVFQAGLAFSGLGGLRNGGLRLGADTPRVLGALSQAFIDGLQLCLVAAAVLTLLAAMVGFVLLRRPRQSAPSATGPAASVQGPRTPSLPTADTRTAAGPQAAAPR